MINLKPKPNKKLKIGSKIEENGKMRSTVKATEIIEFEGGDVFVRKVIGMTFLKTFPGESRLVSRNMEPLFHFQTQAN